MRPQLLFGAIFVIFLVGPSRAEPPDDSLLVYAVNVHRTPMQTWGPGYGIYLGKGLFITAAHVVGRGWLTRPKVAIDGREYPTSIVKEGDFETTDLTLLSIEQSLLPMRLRLRTNSLCKDPPWPGEEVITIVPEAAVHSHVISPAKLPMDVRKFSTVIGDVATTGNSGSGVFDAKNRCLLGIMSRKISLSQMKVGAAKPEIHDVAKYFVPASAISAFLPADFDSKSNPNQ